MTIIRLWLLVLIMTGISWIILKLIRKPMHIGLIFLFWVIAILGSTALLYMVSVWFVSSQ